MTSALVILVLAVACAVVVVLKIWHALAAQHVKKHTWPRILWWFISGHHIDGRRPCCNANHCRPAVRWRRTRARLWPLTALTGCLMAMAGMPGPVYLRAAAGAVTGTVVMWPVRTGRVARVAVTPVVRAARVPALTALPVARSVPAISASAAHHRDVVAPLAAAVAPVLEMTPGQVKRALTVPVNWREPDAQIGLKVRPGWSATLDRQQFIEREVAQRFPGVDWEARYHLGVTPRRVSFVPLPEPPRLVPFASVLGAVESAGQGQPVIGMDARGETVAIDFDRETPHVGLSIGTGGGKSDFLKLLIIQLLVKGVERIVLIDPKGGSARWAEDDFGRVVVPGVEIFYDLDEQWQAIADFRGRMERDYKTWRSDRRQQFTREVLILEEQNDFASESSAYWKANKGKKDPAMPPCFDNVGRVLFKGRQANRNVVSVYQRMSVKATGGLGDIRDQYGQKIVGRFSPAAWDSLVGTRPRGKNSTVPGRMISIAGQEHRLIQAPWASDAVALDYVFSNGLSRIAHPDPSVVTPGSVIVSEQVSEGSGVRGQGVRPLRLVVARRTLREHAERETVPMSYEGLKTARRRDRAGFPAGVDGTYTDEEVKSWFAASGREDKEARA
jgi:hypothetical protein